MDKDRDIVDKQLCLHLEEQYALAVFSLELLTSGLDVDARVYRVVSVSGETYLLKATRRLHYEPAYRVPRLLRNAKIKAVVAPLVTRQQTLWANIDQWTLILYPFIEGDSRWNPAMADGYWYGLGAALKQIQQVDLPAENWQAMHKETFDVAMYGQDIQKIGSRLTHGIEGSDCVLSLCNHWMAHQATIHTAMDVMEALATRLRQQAGPLVICHADLHTANMIRTPGGEVFIVDWDEVMLAPRERDFIFVPDTFLLQSGGAYELSSPFFRGYGGVQLDWHALAYYRFERAIQDLIECARQVLFRADLDEYVKNTAARLFADILSPGDEMEAAFKTAAHLSL